MEDLMANKKSRKGPRPRVRRHPRRGRERMTDGFRFALRTPMWQLFSGTASMADHGTEAFDAYDTHMLAFNANHARSVEFRENSAHGLQLHPQQAADFITRHPKNEIGCRETPSGKALRQIQQERGHPLVCAHASEQHHHALLEHDLFRQHPVQMALCDMPLVAE